LTVPRQRLLEISRSRTEPTGRVERARIILAYLDDPSAYAVARAIGVTQQTVTRCLERAAELGVIEALDDRPRAGRDPVMTAEAKTWLVALVRDHCCRACSNRSPTQDRGLTCIGRLQRRRRESPAYPDVVQSRTPSPTPTMDDVRLPR
jgi:hypothetical protein